MNNEERITDLELRYMAQSDLLEQLNQELIEANRLTTTLQSRVDRLEQAVEGLLKVVDLPVNERPPHY